MIENFGPYTCVDGRAWLDSSRAGILDYLGAVQAILSIIRDRFAEEWDGDRVLTLLEKIAQRQMEQQCIPPSEAEARISYSLSDDLEADRKIHRLLNLCDRDALQAVYERLQGWQYSLSEGGEVAAPRATRELIESASQ